jgi:hypothetical protein
MLLTLWYAVRSLERRLLAGMSTIHDECKYIIIPKSSGNNEPTKKEK